MDIVDAKYYNIKYYFNIYDYPDTDGWIILSIKISIKFILSL